jgi:heterodisulfide reductase subunit A-like polyferredoxin
MFAIKEEMLPGIKQRKASDHEKDSAGNSGKVRIAIIGGGIAGITAAVGAAQIGCEVEVFEEVCPPKSL